MFEFIYLKRSKPTMTAFSALGIARYLLLSDRPEAFLNAESKDIA